MPMKRKKEVIQFLTYGITALALMALYIIAFHCLNKDLKSIFDEGYFFTSLQPRSTFAAYTQPLSLGSNILNAVFPNIVHWDVLSLRRLSFCLKILGLFILSLSSIYFVKKQKDPKSLLSYFILILCIFGVSLLAIPSVVVSMNDELLFCEVLVLSFCLCAVSFPNKWLVAVSVCLVGVCSFFAILCNAPGGVMLLLLSFLFLIFYPGFSRSSALRITLLATLGIVLGVGIMHVKVIRIPDCLAFVNEALSQTAGSSTTSHHSLTRLLISILLNIRDLIITVVSLLGITYVSNLLGRITKKKWMEILIGILLFIIYYKWQVKPGIEFGTIITWLFMMAVIEHIKSKSLSAKEWVLLCFLFLLPFCLSIGSNSGFVFKAKTVIVPWGLLLYYMIETTRDKCPYRSIILYLFVFALLMINPGRYFVGCLSRDSYRFDKEEPICRMHLSKAQYDFYNEVHDVLDSYGYKSHSDTLLGFCFNEMTVVAMNAIPYTNDQYPKEFLQHQGPLPRPSFIILGQWDEMVISPFIETLGWGLDEDYDSFIMKSNPDPDAGYDNSQSTLYCLKSRRLSVNTTDNNDNTI